MEAAAAAGTGAHKGGDADAGEGDDKGGAAMETTEAVRALYTTLGRLCRRPPGVVMERGGDRDDDFDDEEEDRCDPKSAPFLAVIAHEARAAAEEEERERTQNQTSLVSSPSSSSSSSSSPSPSCSPLRVLAVRSFRALATALQASSNDITTTSSSSSGCGISANANGSHGASDNECNSNAAAALEGLLALQDLHTQAGLRSAVADATAFASHARSRRGGRVSAGEMGAIQSAAEALIRAGRASVAAPAAGLPDAKTKASSAPNSPYPNSPCPALRARALAAGAGLCALCLSCLSGLAVASPRSERLGNLRLHTLCAAASALVDDVTSVASSGAAVRGGIDGGGSSGRSGSSAGSLSFSSQDTEAILREAAAVPAVGAGGDSYVHSSRPQLTCALALLSAAEAEARRNDASPRLLVTLKLARVEAMVAAAADAACRSGGARALGEAEAAAVAATEDMWPSLSAMQHTEAQSTAAAATATPAVVLSLERLAYRARASNVPLVAAACYRLSWQLQSIAANINDGCGDFTTDESGGEDVTTVCAVAAVPGILSSLQKLADLDLNFPTLCGGGDEGEARAGRFAQQALQLLSSHRSALIASASASESGGDADWGQACAYVESIAATTWNHAMLLATPLRALRGNGRSVCDTDSCNGVGVGIGIGMNGGGSTTQQQGARVLKLAMLSVRLAAAAAELATQCRRGVEREEESKGRGGKGGEGGEGGFTGSSDRNIGAMHALLKRKLARLEDAIRES